MIGAAVLLVAVAAVALVLGFTSDTLTPVYASIAACLAAAALLVAGVRRQRPQRKPVLQAGGAGQRASWAGAADWPGDDGGEPAASDAAGAPAGADSGAAQPFPADPEPDWVPSDRGADFEQHPAGDSGATADDPWAPPASAPAADQSGEDGDAAEGDESRDDADAFAPRGELDGSGGPELPTVTSVDEPGAPPDEPPDLGEPVPPESFAAQDPAASGGATAGDQPPPEGAPSGPPAKRAPAKRAPAKRAPAKRGASTGAVAAGLDAAAPGAAPRPGRTPRTEAEKFEQALTGVAGLGPARRAALLEHLGTYRRLKAVNVDKLAAVPGINRALAERIHAHLRA